LHEDRQRIDRWLWHARIVRTRNLAAALAESGRVRVNGKKIDACSHAVRAGDVLTIALSGSVKVLRVAAFAERRSGSEAAHALYEDLSPPAPAPEPQPVASVQREPGTGRPTKKDRRALERLRQRSTGHDG
jgi:ribosome-associated heat shock protein Hsp15